MPAASRRLVYACERWEIDLERRELRSAGAPVPLGGRAFEIMGVLVQSDAALVTKNELMEHVWPGVVVGESTIHVHISAIRKALGQDRHLLKTMQGRGYRLVGSWTLQAHDARLPEAPGPDVDTADAPDAAPAPDASTVRRPTNFPVIVSPLVGRSQAVRRVRDLVSAYRVVTMSGPGGIGKTVLAIKAVRGLLDHFEHGAWLIELASLSDPDIVPATIAAVLALPLGGQRVTAATLARAIGNRHLLLLLDNCEHLIDAVAELVETVVRACPAVTILATSREAMRIAGESIYRVAPLEVPGPGTDAPDQILAQSAVELFIARATALDASFSPRADELPVIAEICRRLDGMPLAIELAAARAAFLGTREVARGLRDRFALLTSGRRGVVRRQRTLRATLDWSYELLPEPERRLLRRLAVFSGPFSLAAADAVTRTGEISEIEIAADIANLVSKSLVTPDLQGGQFRLLETTQVYALAKLTEAGERTEMSRRHAAHYRAWLAQSGIGWSMVSGGDTQASLGPASLGPALNNVRAALDWCFGPDGDAAVGADLAAVAAPVLLGLSLLPECHRWSERALGALDADARGAAEEMYLQASLGVASMHLHGPGEAARAALSRSLAIAETRDDALTQVGLLGMLSMLHTRDGHFKTGLAYAQRSRAAATAGRNATATALAHSILGRSLQFAGEHRDAHRELDASFRHWVRAPDTSEVHFGFDHHILVGIGLARTLWLQGHPDQAADRARRTIADAERKNHPASLALALAWVPGIFLWLGDLGAADAHAARLIAHAETNSFGPYLVLGRAYEAISAVRQGDPHAGVDGLRRCLAQLDTARYAMLNTELKISLVQGLMAIGRLDEAQALIDDTLRSIEATEEFYYLPEALRVKGRTLLALPTPRVDDAEACLVQSLAVSERQDAKAWQLRAAVDLAALLLDRGQRERARTTLHPVLAHFVAGSRSADVQAAQSLLARLA